MDSFRLFPFLRVYPSFRERRGRGLGVPTCNASPTRPPCCSEPCSSGTHSFTLHGSRACYGCTWRGKFQPQQFNAVSKAYTDLSCCGQVCMISMFRMVRKWCHLLGTRCPSRMATSAKVRCIVVYILCELPTILHAPSRQSQSRAEQRGSVRCGTHGSEQVSVLTYMVCGSVLGEC
jgi:hypothetical protein